ncbi:hypothetical protein BEN48_16510 [Hymenobacter glacialis]|uniref:TonB-dependent receptor plug domain-containing protein n=1 Tax=Hymenobacter glacialis TaxID=1908236 RepID=A0A1G1SZS5_9BACT|nr:hypothetical protein BEN48_16510 [Hymenobacter glacialis]
MRLVFFNLTAWRLELLLALLVSFTAAAQAPPDSAQLSQRLLRLPEVRVRAVGPERFAVGSRRLELDSAVLAQYRGGNLADVLQARTPISLKNYGPGQLATIALRGTSAQHTAVLWNGLNIMLPTLGQNDFALLPVGATTRVSIQPGPAAALYGSGAVGGAVLLNSDPDWRPGFYGSVQADAGSFGLRGGSLEARTATPTVAVRIASSYREAQNNYSYVLREARGPVRHTLRNAALRHQWSISPDVAWRVGTAGEVTAAAWLTDTDREIQSGVNVTGTQAEERDQSRRLVLGYRHVAARRQWAVRGAWFEDILNYRDGGAPSNSRVRTTRLRPSAPPRWASAAACAWVPKSSVLPRWSTAMARKASPKAAPLPLPCCATTPAPACASRPTCARRRYPQAWPRLRQPPAWSGTCCKLATIPSAIPSRSPSPPRPARPVATARPP